MYVPVPCHHQGGEQMELIPGGAEVAVTANYVHNYVRKYALHRMLVLPHKALKVGHAGSTR